MKILVIAILFLAHSLCIDLELPLNDRDSRLFKVQKSQAQVATDPKHVVDYKVTNVESNGINLITRVLYKGVEIFKDLKPPAVGMTRIVVHTETGYYDTVVVIKAVFSGVLEESYYIAGGTIYNITRINYIIDSVLEGCNKQYSDKVRNVMKTKVPTIEFGEAEPINEEMLENKGKIVNLQFGSIQSEEVQTERVIEEDVNKIMKLMEVNKIQVDGAGPSGVNVEEQNKLRGNVYEFEPDSYTDTDTDSETD